MACSTGAVLDVAGASTGATLASDVSAPGAGTDADEEVTALS